MIYLKSVKKYLISETLELISIDEKTRITNDVISIDEMSDDWFYQLSDEDFGTIKNAINNRETMPKKKENMKICVLCKEPIKSAYGHNAEPIMKGRCCEKCNAYKVVPERIYKMIMMPYINHLNK